MWQMHTTGKLQHTAVLKMWPKKGDKISLTWTQYPCIQGVLSGKLLLMANSYGLQLLISADMLTQHHLHECSTVHPPHTQSLAIIVIVPLELHLTTSELWFGQEQ